MNDDAHTHSWNGCPRFAPGCGANLGNVPPSSKMMHLTYDAFGRMAEDNISGTIYQWVYLPTGKKIAIAAAQSLQWAFIPLPAGAVAEYLPWGLSHYRHPDWLGSDRLGSQFNHTIASGASYAPFGEPYNDIGNGELSFTGANKDTLWLQYDFTFRQYAPHESRWVSPDPVGIAAVDPSNPQTWNRYSYVVNSPLTGTDLYGLYCVPGSCPGDSPMNFPGAATGYFGETLLAFGFLNGHIWGKEDDLCFHCNSVPGKQPKPASTPTAWQTIKNIARNIGNYIPTLCGGGVYNYGGLQVSNGVSSVAVSQIRVADSRDGYLQGPFAEFGYGEGIVGGVGQAQFNNENENFFFGGAGGDLSVVGTNLSAFGTSTGSFGYNLEAEVGPFKGGVGIYQPHLRNLMLGSSLGRLP